MVTTGENIKEPVRIDKIIILTKTSLSWHFLRCAINSLKEWRRTPPQEIYDKDRGHCVLQI